MRAAIVRRAGDTPICADIDPPVPEAGECRVSVVAAALSPIVRGRASGTHYSGSGAVPFGVGIDGVGRLDDGRRVYFVLPRAPFGSMAEVAVVSAQHCIPLPDDVDAVTAAAIANPGLSSWAAFTERAQLVAGETVLINGATGVAGRLAIAIARRLGAGKVIATGRNAAKLYAAMDAGADATIVLTEDRDALEARVREHFAHGVDVVLDYLWGPSAERLLIAAAKEGADGVPIRFVQVGSASGGSIELPGAVLRSSALTLMGSGIGSIAFPRLIQAVTGVLHAAGPGGLSVDTRTVPLDAIADAWLQDAETARTVFTIGDVA